MPAGRHATNTDLPAGTGLTRTPTELRLNRRVQSYVVKLGSAAAGDFPDRPEDGWATALAYREHVLRVVERLREDPGAKVQVAEVDGRGRRLRAWVPGDESVRPNVLAAIRGALGHQPQRKPGGTDKNPGMALRTLCSSKCTLTLSWPTKAVPFTLYCCPLPRHQSNMSTYAAATGTRPSCSF